MVKPYERLGNSQIKDLHEASLDLLERIGIESYNEDASQIFSDNGAEVEKVKKYYKIHIPSHLIIEAIKKTPKKVKLGARNKSNTLILDGKEPRVRFGTGSECNNLLEIEFENFVQKQGDLEIRAPIFKMKKGTVQDLADSAHIAEHLENLDFFIRNLNVQDNGISLENKDVNKFFASFNNTSKHVMAGLTNLEKLDDVLKMGTIIAGGEKEFKENPLVSFITCMTKSPLQFVDDSTQTAIELARRGLVNVISSAPQGGTTAPIQETGIVAQLNAEVLAGITMTQLINPGAPVIYGAVPMRTRLDDLGDMYGAPEFSHYNLDAAQMARHYGIPCYSTGGIADAKVPGTQATIEKLLSHLYVALSGGQYMHCAIGLLGQNNVLNFEQMLLDDAQIGMVKHLLRQPVDNLEDSMKIIEKVMESETKIYTRYSRKEVRSGRVSKPYPFETRTNSDEVLYKAHLRKKELLNGPRNNLSKDILNQIYSEIDGLLPSIKTLT
ncbi:MAG: trimethylamine methyltransferase family protein [Nitrospinota bacterium]